MELIKILKKEYKATFFKQKNDPYYVLISCLLSLRTKDEVTYPAAKRLFSKANTPKAMLTLTEKQIQNLIYPVGFYKRKSKTIQNISRELIEKHNSKVPNTIEELIKFKGVGRKTANIVLAHAFKIPALPVDTHVHRISNRIGWVKTKTPEQTEQALKKRIPKKYWLELNELLVQHGQQICKPISPFCSKCRIKKDCKKAHVTKFR